MRWGGKLIGLILAGVVLAQLGIFVFPYFTGRPDVVQPIVFNHKKHAGELGLPCTTCHQHAETQSFAGLPQAETCMTCHAAALTKSAEEEKIRQYAAKGEKIPWQRIYRMPGDIFFSHRRHLVLGKIECATCHGKMAEQTTPPRKPLVKQTMEWCIACHQERQASADCNACHR